LWAASPQESNDGEDHQRPDVLLITVDTLRPDALGWVEEGRHTPAFDTLARQGFRFPAAVSPAPLTLPAHTSIMTGLVPRRHGVRANGQLLGTAVPLLAEQLRSQGYTTAAFVSGFPLSAAAGLDRGFDHYDDHFDQDSARGAAHGTERRAATTTAAALRFMAQAEGPWFLWVHYYDPHDPYEPPSEFRRPGLRGAYDGEVAAVDHAFGQLRSGLDRIAQRPRLTVFTADHGESLGEHGEATHGFFLYESTMAVPLVIHFPGHLTAGESRVAARLVDVTPTILQLLGLPDLAAGLDGVGLGHLMGDKAWLQPPAYIESRRPWRSYGWSPLRAIRLGFWKLIVAPHPELYNLEDDPGEEHNLLTEQRAVARDLASLLKTIEERPTLQPTSTTTATTTATTTVDAETLARLRSLGYTGGPGQSREPPADAADPKDRIAQWNALGTAEQLLSEGQPQSALKKFDEVLKEDPKNPFALARSGAALLTLGRAEEAIPRLENAAKFQPNHAEIRRDLAQALTAARHLDGAVEAWMEVTRLEPRNPETWVRLGNILGAAHQPAKAVDAFTRATELAPERPDLEIRLGFAQHAAGQLAASIASLEHAATLTGVDAFPHAAALGLLLLRQDQPHKARAWLARSRSQEGDFAEARYQAARLEAATGNEQAARRHLAVALKVQPAWSQRAAQDPSLQPILP
jgi:arylsulfatase A-like enzyme/tetratricopeptide (TPR) repeat protein